MAKLISYNPDHLIWQLKDLGDSVHRGRACVRKWDTHIIALSPVVAQQFQRHFFEVVEVPHPSFKGAGRPEKELLELLSRALAHLEGRVQGSRDSVEIMDIQWIQDMPSQSVGSIRCEITIAVIDKFGASIGQVTQAAQRVNTALAAFPNSVPDLRPVEPLPYKGVSIEPIVAYRDFTLDPHWETGPTLYSRNGVSWEPKEKHHAICTKDGGGGIFGHDAPHEDCECGIYAFMNPDHKDMKMSDSQIWGEIYLWGEVLICDTGYRAQFAYPRTLFLMDTGTKVIQWVRDQLETEYGVPVLLMKETDKNKRLSHLMDEALSELLNGRG